MELLLSVALKTTKRKSWTFYIECSWETEFSCAVSGTQDRWPIKIKSFFPFPMESGLPMLPGVGGDDKKNKRPYLCFWFARWWKASLLYFPSRGDSFNSQFCFHETQGRSDNSTGKKKKKSPPSFRSENSQMKRIFLKSRQVGFSALYLPVKTNMYFVLSLNTEQVDRAERPSALFIHLRRTPSLQKEQASKTCDF